MRADVVTGRAARVTGEIRAEATMGRKMVDWEASPATCNATVIETVDADGLFALLMECLGRL